MNYAVNCFGCRLVLNYPAVAPLSHVSLFRCNTHKDVRQGSSDEPTPIVVARDLYKMPKEARSSFCVDSSALRQGTDPEDCQPNSTAKSITSRSLEGTVLD